MSALTPLRRARSWQALSLLPTCAVAGYALDLDVAQGVLWGGAITAVNLALMEAVGRRSLAAGASKRRAPLLILAKFATVATLFGAVLTFIEPDLVGFALGFGTFLVGVLGAALGTRHPKALRA